jgi:hypothetical protein
MLLHPDVLKAMSTAGDRGDASRERHADRPAATKRSRAAALAARLRPARRARARIATRPSG